MGEIPSHSQAILHRFTLRRLFNFFLLYLFGFDVVAVAVVDRTHNWQKKLCAHTTQHS